MSIMYRERKNCTKGAQHLILLCQALDSGEQVKSYAASTKRNTRGKKQGETGAEAGALIFFPLPPSEHLEQANCALESRSSQLFQFLSC